MRVNRLPLQGERGRIAARVRELLDDDDPPAPPDPLAPRPSAMDRLAALVPVRIDPGRRTALAVGVAVIVAAVLTGLWVMTARPRALAVSGAVAPSGSSIPSLLGSPLTSLSSPVLPGAPPAAVAASGSSSAAVVVVDVAGKVRRPGLYSLPAGSRIDDALTAAGGARSGVDLRSLNLAAPLVDGEQILVGRGAPAGAGGVVPAAAPGAPVASSTAIAPVSLNTATLEQLETLPGVGPVTGQKILDYRSAHGSFTSIDQLKDVSGIGDVTFAELEPLVTL